MATYYWRGGSGTWDSSNTANWSNVSGGAGGFGPPTSTDDVVFNSASSGASYVVTITSSAYCHALSTAAPATGTLTFDATSGMYPTVYGNISVHAACLWTVNGGTTSTATLSHNYADATAATVTFGSSGANTKCIKFYPNAGSIPLGTAYNFCVGTTATFAEVYGNIGTATFTCTSAAISIIDPGAADYVTERFYIIGSSFSPPTLTLTSTTLTMGQVGAFTMYGDVIFDYFGTFNTTGFNVTCTRTYYNFKLSSRNTSVDAVMGNVTTKNTGSNSELHGFRTVGALSHAGGGILYVSSNTSSAFVATSLATTDANSAIYIGSAGSTSHSLWTSASISGTTAVGASGTISIKGADSGFTGLNATFTGAVTVAAGGSFTVYPSSTCSFSTVTTSGTLASPAFFTVYGTTTGYPTYTFPLTTCSGNSSFTWTTVDLGNTKWEQLTTSTFTATSPTPTTVGPQVTVAALKTNGGAVSITNQPFSVGAQYAYFTVSTVDYSMYITTGGLTLNASGVALNGGSPTTSCTLSGYYYPSYVAGASSFNNVTVNSYNSFTSATSTSLTTVYWAASNLVAFGALTTTGTIAAYTTIYGFSSMTATTGNLTNTNIYSPSGAVTFNGTVTHTTTDLTTAQFQFYVYSFVNGAAASTFTSMANFYAVGPGPSGKSISSGGALTFNNSSVTTYPIGSASVQTTNGIACTSLTVNNLGLSTAGDYSASSSTALTAGVTNSTFTFAGFSTAAFGALTATAGAAGSTLSLSASGSATASTISTTNMTVYGPDAVVTATSTVSFTGNTGLSQSVSLNTVIGSSTVAFTNFSSVTIWGSSALSPTHTLKGTTLTVDSSGLTSSTFSCGNYTGYFPGPFPPVTFTGAASFNNVAATFGNSGLIPAVTFVGTTLTKGTNTSTALQFLYTNTPTTHSLGAITATSGGTISASSGNTVNSGAITATNVAFSCALAGWSAAGTVAIAPSPTSSSLSQDFLYFINGAFSTTFTSCNVTFYGTSPSGPSIDNSFYSSGDLVFNDTGLSSPGNFSAAGKVTFVTGAVTATSWTKKNITLSGGLTATGAAGLTLTSSSISDGATISAAGTMSITGPLTLTSQVNPNFYGQVTSGSFTTTGSAQTVTFNNTLNTGALTLSGGTVLNCVGNVVMGAFSATSATGVTLNFYGSTVSSTSITASNTIFNCSSVGWTAAGTVAISTTPTSSSTSANFNYFINGAFTTTFTSYDVSFAGASPSGASSGCAFYSTGNLVLDDSGRAAAGSYIAINGNTVFVTGAGVTTWTRKSVQIAGLTATGAGGLTLTTPAIGDQAGVQATGNISITGPLTLTNQKFSGGINAFSCDNLTVGGAFVANNSPSAGQNTRVNIATSAAITGATTFTKVGLYCGSNYASTGAASFTGEGSANTNPDNTFTVNGTLSTLTGASNLTIADYYSLTLGSVASAAALSITHSSQMVDATCSGNISQSAAGLTTTITRIRLRGSTTSTFTSYGAMTLSTASSLYGFLSFDLAAVTANAGSASYACLSAGAMTFSGAVSLTNTDVWVNGNASGAIVIAGGASKPFSFTIDSTAIPCDNYSLNRTNSANYPGMAFASLTLTNSGSTFSITSATVYKRPLISFAQSSAASAVISIPSGVTPTFTNVDFWRIAPGGTSTKPWTGTSLGRVGAEIPNLTTTAPKSVYYVGGAGAWDGSKWATSSGGTGATANYPLPQDNITFDVNSGGGTTTVPASIRIGTLYLNGTSPGLTKITPTVTTGSLSNEIWVCGSILGPTSDPGVSNLFYLGDTSVTSNVYVIFVDGGSSETVTVTNSQNMAIASGARIQYMNAGTLNLPEVAYTGISAPIGFIPFTVGGSTSQVDIDASTRVINLTSSTFNTSSFFYVAAGTFNFANCTISSSAYRVYSGTVAIPATAYTCNVFSSYLLNATVTESIGGATAAHLGNLRYSLTGTSGTFSCSVNNPVFLSVRVSDATSSTVTFSITSLGSSRNLYTLSTFTVTNNSGGTFNFRNTTGAAITLIGVAGARNQWTGITIGSSTPSAYINASPASPATWYYSGGSLFAGQTGWNSGTAPVANTGFLFF